MAFPIGSRLLLLLLLLVLLPPAVVPAQAGAASDGHALDRLQRILAADPDAVPEPGAIAANLGAVLGRTGLDLQPDDFVGRRATPGAVPACARPAPTARRDVTGALRGLLLAESVEEWRCAAVLMALMPAGRNAAVAADTAAAAAAADSLLALLFRRTLPLEDVAEALSGIYVRIVRRAEPQSDALRVFFEHVAPALGEAESAADPVPDNLQRLKWVWDELLLRCPLADVRGLAQRNAAVLSPRTWAWTFFGVVRRVFVRRRRAWRWQRRDTVAEWRASVQEAALPSTASQLDALQIATLIRFVYGDDGALTAADVVRSVLVNGRIDRRQISPGPLGKSASNALLAQFNQLLADRRIAPAQVLYGLYRGQAAGLACLLSSRAP